MIDPEEIKRWLQATWEDRRISDAERRALTAALTEVGGDESVLRSVRNRAFEMLREAAAVGAAELSWLEDVLRAIDNARPEPQRTVARVVFSPGDDCWQEVVRRTAASEASIDVCVFTITDDRIATALETAHNRGIRVRVLTDDEKAYDPGSDITRFAAAGIEIATDDCPDHMHHKFALFDRRWLLTGSFNWTRGASDRNIENLLTTDDARLVQEFGEEFDRLWKRLA